MRVIRLLYRKIIDASSQSAWEKLVFNDSYTEFIMQAQLYNQEKKYITFGELIAYVPNAEKLHFLVSGSVVGYLKQLNRKVPDILNNSGKLFLPFSNYKFEIINSDIKDKSKHQVAVNFMSEPLTWYDTIGNQLLVALDTTPVNDEILTEQFAMQPFLSICSLKEIK
ncbi:hypothetical protein GO495_02755 [Chitinophaga oryziterrae]|uniref:Uncharacterized protein n=1 Tax=Chitinophaga oryziterrae TaxID=1031224 RepID=A0A6N8J5E5_9BACT|nr:hypothetical protein [Chitinophaga oryziterrae]MVT39496.1 hypothetical protein [Chitinophaga oryziterrae]